MRCNHCHNFSVITLSSMIRENLLKAKLRSYLILAKRSRNWLRFRTNMVNYSRSFSLKASSQKMLLLIIRPLCSQRPWDPPISVRIRSNTKLLCRLLYSPKCSRCLSISPRSKRSSTMRSRSEVGEPSKWKIDSLKTIRTRVDMRPWTTRVRTLTLTPTLRLRCNLTSISEVMNLNKPWPSPSTETTCSRIKTLDTLIKTTMYLKALHLPSSWTRRCHRMIVLSLEALITSSILWARMSSRTHSSRKIWVVRRVSN